MSCRSNTLVICLLAVALVISNTMLPTVRAQEPANKSKVTDAQKEKEIEQRQELEKKTLALLNDIASAALGLKLLENRIFITTGAADLLWTFDEKRARNLYWEALNSITSTTPLVPGNNESLSKGERERLSRAYSSSFLKRQKLLRQIASRDAQLALDMLRATRQVPPSQLGSEWIFTNDRELEQEIASEIAARDPAQALQLARQGLAKGFTFELLNLLYRLNQKDSEKASQFAGDIIGKLQTVNVATDIRASVIAVHLLENSRERQVTRSVDLLYAGNIRTLSLSDDQKRKLVEMLTDAALSTSANSNLLYEISELMPEIQQFFPERRAALERRVAAFNETLPRGRRNQNIYNTLIRRGIPEEIIRSAATADEANRMMLYRQAAIIAVGRGKTDSFRDFLSNEVSDSGRRREILDLLDAEEIDTAVARKQLDNLRNLLPKIVGKEERARALAEVALLLKEKGEDAEAASLLDEAASLIKTDLKDERKTNALLTLLVAYAVVEPAKAFALAEQTVDRANDQISLLMLLDRVVKSGAVKNSEINLEQAGIMPLDVLVFRYGKGLVALAKADFNRTKALADRFERNELRLMAQLLLLKGLLQPEAYSGKL